MASAKSVLELSRAVVGGRNGLVVVIKIFMDESGIHEGSPIVTVGAYIAKPKQWKSFTTEWNAKKKPIDIFHATDCAALRGEFKGWNEPDRDNLVAKILPVIPKHIPAGILVGIDMRVFEDAMKPYPQLKEMFPTAYGGCFQWAIQIFLDIVEKAGSNERLAFFHERNAFQGEAMKSFEWVAAHRRSHSSQMTLTFGTKEAYTPLQAADVLAYEGNKRLRDISRPKRRAWQALDKGLSVYRYGADNIPWLVERLLDVEKEVKTFGKPVEFLSNEAPRKRREHDEGG